MDNEWTPPTEAELDRELEEIKAAIAEDDAGRYDEGFEDPTFDGPDPDPMGRVVKFPCRGCGATFDFPEELDAHAASCPEVIAWGGAE